MPGRGRARGRGRGRGFSRRGGSRGRCGIPKQSEEELTVNDPAPDLRDDAAGFFTKNASFDQHFTAQTDSRPCYCAAIRAMEKWKVEIPQSSKVKSLAAAWARGDNELADALLQRKTLFGVVEVSKAVILLDSGRQARVFEKKLRRLQIQKNKVKGETIGKLKSKTDNLSKMKPSTGSSSGAVCKRVKRWTRTLTRQELEFFALHFPVGLWKKLADICHFHPVKDFAVPWFLPFCFGDAPPEDSLVHNCCDISESNINELLQDYHVPYIIAKPFIRHVTDEMKGKIAKREEKLDTILWYYEELKCPEVDREIEKRLRDGDPVTLALGKLLDRVLTFRLLQAGDILNPEEHEKQICKLYESWDWDAKPEGPGVWEKVPNPDIATFSPKLEEIAQKRLDKIRFALDSPVVVLGDKSGSMDVAIRTSSIISGILAVITSAKVVFFDEECRKAPYVPSTVQEVINLAMEVNAGGGTCPAAALLPFYQKKEVVKTFVVVTDEEEVERDPATSLFFAEMFKRYHDEVYPAKLVFVSFLTGEGQMVGALRKLGFSPLQFKFDYLKPDLSKLDNLFALQSAETATFKSHVERLEKKIVTEGITSVFQDDGLVEKDTHQLQDGV